MLLEQRTDVVVVLSTLCHVKLRIYKCYIYVIQ